jgi:sterol desaturase/sphingolipid hydroxylase (fatty acid hydroxylase superfamily)
LLLERATTDLLSLLFYALGFSLLESFFPVHKGQRHWRSDLWVDLGHGFINFFLGFVLIALTLAPVFFLIPLITPAWFQSWVLAQPWWLQFIEVMLVADLGIYVGHRLMHQVPFLWKFHSIHHSAKELNWATAYRSHTIDLVVMRWWMLLLLLLIPFDISVTKAHAIYFGAHSAFLHANLRFDLGPLRMLYAFPWFHRWHHSDLPEARDKNFVSHFPWVDALFGTLYFPKEPPKTLGTTEPVPAHLIDQLLYPFRSKPKAKEKLDLL